MSKISSDSVKKVAKLANLPISSDEEKVFTDQLGKILEYVEQLEKVDTSKVEPTFNVTGLKNILREDVVTESLEQGQALFKALFNAPKKKDGLFVTKGVLKDE